MRVLLVHQYFRTPSEGGGIRSWYIARHLVKNGVSVKVLTTHNELEGDHLIDEIPIQYYRIPYSNHLSYLNRIFAFLKFSWASRSYVRKNSKNIDLLYVISTPLTTGFTALFARKRFNIPYVFGNWRPLARDSH